MKPTYWPYRSLRQGEILESLHGKAESSTRNLSRTGTAHSIISGHKVMDMILTIYVLRSEVTVAAFRVGGKLKASSLINPQ